MQVAKAGHVECNPGAPCHGHILQVSVAIVVLLLTSMILPGKGAMRRPLTTNVTGARMCYRDA